MLFFSFLLKFKLMKPFRDPMSFWNWLPEFRAVTDTEHLNEAAEQLGISPPALSRTVGRLKERLGVELLVRHAWGLRRTEAEPLHQDAVRDAMRISVARERIEQGALVGELRICSFAPATELFLGRALREFSAQHPRMSVHWTQLPLGRVRTALQANELNVALLRSPVAPEGISVAPLETLPVGLCAPPRSYQLSTRRRFGLRTPAHALVAGLLGVGASEARAHTESPSSVSKRARRRRS